MCNKRAGFGVLLAITRLQMNLHKIENTVFSGL